MVSRLGPGDVEQYAPSQLTFEFNDTLLQQLQAEFEAIYRALQGVHHLPIRRAEPPRPKEGMVAYAPGGQGWSPPGAPGFFGYTPAGWVKLG